MSGTARFSPDETVVPEAAAYRPLSVAAVLALLLGLVSFTALLTPMLWAVAFAGVIVSVVAWVRIHRFEPPLTGRTAALLGLILSLFTAAAAPTQWYVRRALLVQEAQQFVQLFFDYLKENQPHKAHQLSMAARQRSPIDENLWAKYAPETNARKDLEAFLERKEVRAILILSKDPRTTIRLFDIEGVWREDDEDRVALSYAVTYFDSDNKKRTFFVNVSANRYSMKMQGVSDWYISNISSYAAPQALEAEKAAWDEKQKKQRPLAAPVDERSSPDE
jgi:hypothetical protein